MNFTSFIKKTAVPFGIMIVLSLMTASLQAQGTGDTTGDTSATGDTTTGKNINQPASDGWRTEDYKPYITSIQELEKLSKDYSDSRLKLAKDEYSKGVDILDDMVAEIARVTEIYKEKKYLEEK